MRARNLFKAAAVISIALACLSIKCYCAEHPEHPTGKQKPALTKEQLADAIEAYIKKGADANGNFSITDEKTGEKIPMKLEKVHRERLAKVGAEEYFACVDFKCPEGKVYDVDFFMKGTAKDNLTFTEFMIHKVDGKPRYTWHEENGVWKRKPVESAEQPKEKPKAEPNEPKEKPKEHPEHPK
jgi:hypothetical protein